MYSYILTGFVLALINSQIFVSAADLQSQPFNISTIAAVNNTSVIQCWQLETPLETSQTAGIVGASSLPLGSFVNATYGALASHYAGSPHPAPSVQYVFPSRLF